MRDTYTLKINCNSDTLGQVEETVRQKSDNPDFPFWEWTLDDDRRPDDAVNAFLNLLQGKYDALASIGIQRERISIWHYYEYDNECGLEISPKLMKKMGDEGIVLCISCWQQAREEA